MTILIIYALVITFFLGATTAYILAERTHYQQMFNATFGNVDDNWLDEAYDKNEGDTNTHKSSSKPHKKSIRQTALSNPNKLSSPSPILESYELVSELPYETLPSEPRKQRRSKPKATDHTAKPPVTAKGRLATAKSKRDTHGRFIKGEKK